MLVASTTSFLTTVLGTVLTEGQSAVTNVLQSYVGVFLTLVVGVSIIGAVVALVKKTPHAIFGSSKK
jgi:hypothetical protein